MCHPSLTLSLLFHTLHAHTQEVNSSYLVFKTWHKNGVDGVSAINSIDIHCFTSTTFISLWKFCTYKTLRVRRRKRAQN